MLDCSCSLALLVSTVTITDFYKVHNTGILGWIECHLWNNELLSFGLFLSSTWNIVILTVERFVSFTSVNFILHFLFARLTCMIGQECTLVLTVRAVIIQSKGLNVHRGRNPRSQKHHLIIQIQLESLADPAPGWGPSFYD